MQGSTHRPRVGLVVCTMIVMAAGLTPLAAHPPEEGGEHAVPAQVDTTSRVSIEIKDGYRFIKSNGLPDHATGKFPNRDNPGRIQAQEFSFRVPVKPTLSEKPVDLGPSGRPPGDRRGAGGQDRRGGDRRSGPGKPPVLFGVALNGVVFDPGTAEWWNDDPSSGWHVDAMGPTTHLGVDDNKAHVQPPTGTYHYHGVPKALVAKLAGEHPGSAMTLVGWAADGFPVYALWGHSEAGDAKSPVKKLTSSYRLKPGDRAQQERGPGGKHDGTYVEDFEYIKGLGDLDEFNGRTGVTPEFPGGTYYYVLTDEFPSVPRQLRGVPDGSFTKGPPRGGRRPGEDGPGDGRNNENDRPRRPRGEDRPPR